MQELNNIDHVSNNNSNRKLITLSKQQADRLKQKAKQFQTQFEQQKAEFMKQDVIQEKQQDNNSQQNKSQSAVYYIVSSLFLTQWRDFTMQHTIQRLLPEQMNQNILDQEYKLKLDLKQGQDFQFISSVLYYKYFKQFQPLNKSFMLQRRQIFIGKQKRIPLYLRPYKYLPLSHINLREIDRSCLNPQLIKMQQLQASQYTSITSFLQQIKQHHRYSMIRQLRLWTIKKNITITKLFQHIKQITKKIFLNQFKVKLLGKRINGDMQLCDLQYQYENGDYFVIQVKDSMKRWHFYQDNQEKCTVCMEYAELKCICHCKQIAYCSEQCKIKDSVFHNRVCNGNSNNNNSSNSYVNGSNIINNNIKKQPYQTRTTSSYSDNQQSCAMNLTQYSSRGKVGLSNLGNTCFMNSCLQCLSNTLPLTQYFISGFYQSQINSSNPIGSHGKLARSYGRFIKSMWCDSNTYFSPSDIKMKVSSINPMFSGFAQHDSQQFFTFIVDGLHEDLNRVEKKPYVEIIESQGKKDHVVALQSWINYLKRNQSIIVDLMIGQYRSQVTCPDCKMESVTFDPFITVTLPIPQKSFDHISFYLIYHNFQKQTQLRYLSYNKLDLNQWMNQASKLTELDKNKFNLYVMSANQSIYKISQLPMSQILHKIQQQKKTVFMIQKSQQQINYKQPLQINIKLIKLKNDIQTHLWFKFPFLFEKAGNITGLIVYKKILEFLYKKAYLKMKSSSQNSNNKKTSINSQDDILQTKQEYLTKMLSQKPFKLYLKTDKREQRSYHRVQYVFDKQILIEHDTDILQIIEQQTQNGYYQIHAKFTSQSLNQFKMQSLKHYDQKMTRPVKQSSQKFSVQLSECFQHLSESQKLIKGNQWYCSKCKSHKLATKQMSIYKAPKILIIHLKRFKQKSNNRRQKNQAHVIFPMQLNMKPYLINSTPMSSYYQQIKQAGVYIQPNINQQIKVSDEPVYELYAVSNHFGGMGGGHYTAYAKNGNKWYDFNDSSVRQISEMDACKRSAYMLFYKRKD